jgi:hypothetical protein
MDDAGSVGDSAGTRTAQRPDAGGRHLRLAVSDGPDGRSFIRLSGDRSEGLRVRAEHPAGFHCSRVLGGCGERLTLAAGKVYAAHFKHRSGTVQGCALQRDPTSAATTLTHLLLQEHLRAWLREQGLKAEIEKRLSHGGRADLHVRVADHSQSIEVQLSALGHDTWVKRTALYQRQVRHLHWLYGPEVGGGLADEETAVRGWALLITAPLLVVCPTSP